MKRYPNPWFFLPVVAAGVAGALIGRNFARVACLPVEADAVAAGCGGRELLWAVLGALGAAVGVAVVIVLAIRSLAEWRHYQRGEGDRPEAGCEREEREDGEGRPAQP